LEVPFATVDCSSLTQAGYIGSDIESSIERLLLAASHSIPKCETGIIFFDEVDKLAKPAVMTHGRDVSGEGVQQGLLKMIEGTTVTINAKQDRNSKTEASSSRGGDRIERGNRESSAQPGKSEQYTIDTTNILFVFAGAFVGLEKIVAKRLSAGSSIGFGAPIRPPAKKSSPNEPPNLLQKVNTSDLQAYGLIPELLGRIPITVSLSPLSLDQLVSILRDPKNSLIKQYTALFASYNVSLRFTTASLHTLATQALQSTSSLSRNPKEDTSSPGMGVGARGLRTILESVLQETMFIAPGSDIRFCLIDEAFVKGHFKPAEEGREGERERVPKWWSRGASVAFEEAYEREEREWDDKVNGKSEDDDDKGGFERLRVGGSSGM
jgi:ATP-dependent Clp protease ATP-binding subunit ClpX